MKRRRRHWSASWRALSQDSLLTDILQEAEPV
jgi:hypothetical protein